MEDDYVSQLGKKTDVSSSKFIYNYSNEINNKNLTCDIVYFAGAAAAASRKKKQASTLKW